MLDKIIHVNSKNESLNFFELGIYINYNDLRDYEWNVISDAYNRIAGFNRAVTKKKIPFVFYVKEEQAKEIKNKFYEHFETDIFNNQKGYFEINGYKYYCYVTKSVKSDYLIEKGLLNITLEVTTDEAYWVKEKVNSIDFSKLGEETDGLKYTFKYPFTYRFATSASIYNEDFVASDGIIRIYGEAINPLVKINDNVYQVNATIGSNERIEINTFNKTIYKISNYGDVTNVFHLRNKEYDVFQPIPSGHISVASNGNFLVDIICIERRGEPKWD